MRRTLEETLEKWKRKLWTVAPTTGLFDNLPPEDLQAIEGSCNVHLTEYRAAEELGRVLQKFDEIHETCLNQHKLLDRIEALEEEMETKENKKVIRK